MSDGIVFARSAERLAIVFASTTALTIVSALPARERSNLIVRMFGSALTLLAASGLFVTDCR